MEFCCNNHSDNIRSWQNIYPEVKGTLLRVVVVSIVVLGHRNGTILHASPVHSVVFPVSIVLIRFCCLIEFVVAVCGGTGKLSAARCEWKFEIQIHHPIQNEPVPIFGTKNEWLWRKSAFGAPNETKTWRRNEIFGNKKIYWNTRESAATMTPHLVRCYLMSSAFVCVLLFICLWANQHKYIHTFLHIFV